MTNEDDKVKAYMRAHPKLVARIAEKHGVEVVEEGLPGDYLEQTVEEEEEPKKPKRFGEGSSAEPNNDTTL